MMLSDDEAKNDIIFNYILPSQLYVPVGYQQIKRKQHYKYQGKSTTQ